jgi:hypothetical protein
MKQTSEIEHESISTGNTDLWEKCDQHSEFFSATFPIHLHVINGRRTHTISIIPGGVIQRPGAVPFLSISK